ncbi:SGNH/GDSL hydrolase family protein [Treponema sp.]
MNIESRHVSIWGDSILKGVILDDTDGRYRVLENNCVKRFADITGSVIKNNASFGMTATKALERIRRAVGRNPPVVDDLVLIEFGGNDCDFNWPEISADPESPHLPKTPIDLFGTTLQSIVDLFKGFSIKPILMALPPLDPARYFSWISRGLNAENILGWLGDVNLIYRWQEAYNEVVTQTAVANDLQFINIRKSFLVSNNFSSKLCTDGIHPSEEGQKVILKSVLDYVEAV